MDTNSDVKVEAISDPLNSAVQHAMEEQSGPLRRVSVACAACRKSHVCCDNRRPCGRCQTRRLDCVEIESKKRGPKKSRKDEGNSSSSSSSSSSSYDKNRVTPPPPQYINNNNNNASMMLPPITPPTTSPLFTAHFPSSPLNGFMNLIPSNYSNYSNNIKEGDFRRLPLPSSPWKPDGNEYYPIKSPSFLPSPQGSDGHEKGYELDLEELLNSPAFGANLFDSIPPEQPSPAVEEGKEEEEIVPPSFFMRDPKSLEQIYEILKRKKAKLFKNKEDWTRIHKKVDDLKKFITKEQKKMLVKEFWCQLKELEHGASLVEVPVMIHERSGTIHFTNQAWLETMGYKIDIDNPNPIKGQLIFEHISTNTINAFGSAMPSFFLATEVKSCKFEAEIKIAGNPDEEEKYLGGMAISTIKRDIFGLPQLFVCHFIPHFAPKVSKDLEKVQLVMIPPYGTQPPGTVPINE